MPIGASIGATFIFEHQKARNSYITAFLAYILLLADRPFHLITNQPIQLNRIFHR